MTRKYDELAIWGEALKVPSVKNIMRLRREDIDAHIRAFGAYAGHADNKLQAARRLQAELMRNASPSARAQALESDLDSESWFVCYTRPGSTLESTFYGVVKCRNMSSALQHYHALDMMLAKSGEPYELHQPERARSEALDALAQLFD